jgi:hypothetical protein
MKQEKARRNDPEAVLGVFDITIIKLNKKVTFSEKVINRSTMLYLP